METREVAMAEVLGSMLTGIVQARAISDQYSAELSLGYMKDDVLRHFTVPRVEIADLTISLKFAVVGADAKAGPIIIVDPAKLREVMPEAISSVTLTTKLRNYAWAVPEPGAVSPDRLVEVR